MTLMGIQPSYNLTKLGTPDGYPERFGVEDAESDWGSNIINYHPVEYTSETVIAAEWADPEIVNPQIVMARDFSGRLATNPTAQLIFSDAGDSIRYKCPWGRTGITGRGLLGKWGPNNVANTLIYDDTNTILLVKRKSGMWALPGGFLNTGEVMGIAATREVKEEVNILTSCYMHDPYLANIFTPTPLTTDDAWVMSHFFSHRSTPDLMDMASFNYAKDELDGTMMLTGQEVPYMKEQILPVHFFAIESFFDSIKANSKG